MSNAPAPPAMDLLNLTGRYALITGASGGIGRVIATQFAAAGATVILQYHRNTHAIETLQKNIIQEGGAATCLQADLCCEDQVKEAFKQISDTYSALDILVNAAGDFPTCAFRDMTLAKWRQMFAVNLESAMLCSKYARELMVHSNRSRGRDTTHSSIINISSIAGIAPGADHSHYNSAKAAMIQMGRSLAQEFGPIGIRVNTVSPGLIMRKKLATDWPDGLERWCKKAPLGRVGQAIDVANACLFLASPMAEFITGTNIPVDGGVLSAAPY